MPTLDLFFRSARPPVVGLPHLITAMDAELLAQVVHITDSSPGLWHIPAPYDENDRYDPWRDSDSPFALWKLAPNQAELLSPGRFAAEALFGTQAVVLDAGVDEQAVSTLTQVRGRRHENGGFYVDGLQDLSALPQLVGVTRWILIPVAPDRGCGLFVASPADAGWIEDLSKWCDRMGRTHWCVIADAEGARLQETLAAAPARDRAVGQAIDEFLGRVDRYFRAADESLLPRIQDRLAAARDLEEVIARSKAAAPGPR